MVERDERIGKRVICIADKFLDEPTNPFKASELKLPVKGEEYTVRDIVSTEYGEGFLLDEIENRKYFFDDVKRSKEPVFSVGRFRLV